MIRIYLSLVAVIFFIASPTAFGSHNDLSTIEKMYNKNKKPMHSDEDATLAVSVEKQLSKFTFVLSNSNQTLVLDQSDIYDILNQEKTGIYFAPT